MPRWTWNMNCMNCICYGVFFQWISRFGGRLSSLEKRVEYLEQHVIIDIEALEKMD
uniref:Uncharacterized protein n=1 Tax=viral metagenome TaxID=1070528 RepID=A0A6C0DE95_9ZZZZ